MPRQNLEFRLCKTSRARRSGLPARLTQRTRVSGALRIIAERLRKTEAAELVEFALALPMILVMVLGLMDFAHAYNLKQKLANAAREGARLGASESQIDLTSNTCPTTSSAPGGPCSVEAIYTDVWSYLQNAGIDPSTFIGTSAPTACVTSGNPNGFCWQYYTTGNYGLMIEREVQVPSSNGTIYSTRVTLTYPYNWTYGFDKIIKLLVPSANYSGTVTIETDAMMPNLSQ